MGKAAGSFRAFNSQGFDKLGPRAGGGGSNPPRNPRPSGLGSRQPPCAFSTTLRGMTPQGAGRGTQCYLPHHQPVPAPHRDGTGRTRPGQAPARSGRARDRTGQGRARSTSTPATPGPKATARQGTGQGRVRPTKVRTDRPTTPPTTRQGTGQDGSGASPPTPGQATRRRQAEQGTDRARYTPASGRTWDGVYHLVPYRYLHPV